MSSEEIYYVRMKANYNWSQHQYSEGEIYPVDKSMHSKMIEYGAAVNCKNPDLHISKWCNLMRREWSDPGDSVIYLLNTVHDQQVKIDGLEARLQALEAAP